MKFLFVFLSFSLSALLAWFIIPRILIVTYKKKLFDIPDERKVHRQAVPRLGGISFAPSLLISILLVVGLRYLTGYDIPYAYSQRVVVEFIFLLCGLILLHLIGFWDDLVGLRYREKFLFQIIAAALMTVSGLWINSF